MSDHSEIIDQAIAWRGEPMALATVISTWGSAPRPSGSHLLYRHDGLFAGSVSGGCVEADVMETAAQVIRDGTAQQRRYGVADRSAWEVGLPCGGEISILVQRVDPLGFPPDLFDRIADARDRGEALTISTHLQSGQSHAGLELGAFRNTYLPPRQLLIVGGVQIAQTLAKLAQDIELKPVIIDPRGAFLTSDRFPGVELDDNWPDEAIRSHRPGPSTAVITLSHDIKIDDPALIEALRSKAAYIGALGSRKSHAARLERLRAQGVDEADLARIDGPAGLDIGSVGTAEIALSILSAAIATFHGKYNPRLKVPGSVGV